MTPRNFSSEKIDCPPALQPHIDLCTSVLIESFDDNNSEHETGKTEKKYIPLEKNSK